jgi:ribokinase
MVDAAVVRSARETLARAARPPSPRVTVLGSLNTDISVTSSRLPAPGMTVLGSAARFAPGGKGANQAVAAARLGAEVYMAGCVGGDDFGRRLIDALHAEGVDADGVRVVPGAPTGLAMITVDPAGENLITVSPGANDEVSGDDAAAALSDGADVLVISAEIPVPAIRAALAPAGKNACDPAPCRILNLAPVPPADEVAALLAAGPDWLVVNESEASAILGKPVDTLAAAETAAADLAAACAGHAVVTVGARGAVLAGPTVDSLAIPGFHVEAVDTVGAGDTFVGALAVALAAGVPAAEAIRAAAAAAAVAVTSSGAQAAMPRPADVLVVTGMAWPVGSPTQAAEPGSR